MATDTVTTAGTLRFRAINKAQADPEVKPGLAAVNGANVTIGKGDDR